MSWRLRAGTGGLDLFSESSPGQIVLWTLASRPDKEWGEQHRHCLLVTISILMRLKRDDIRKRSRSARSMSLHSDMILYWVSALTVFSGLANAVAHTCRYRRGSAVSRGIWRSCTSVADSNKDSGFFHLWLLSFLASESFWNHAVGRQKKKENHESSGKFYRSTLGYYFFSRIS